jgi:protein-disulfide isomerase
VQVEDQASVAGGGFGSMGRKTSLFIAVVLIPFASVQCTPSAPEYIDWEILSTDHILAVGDPKVTVIEYSEFECPFCGRFARETFPAIRLAYIDTGKVRWIFRHFPLPAHDHAQAAAEASECAADQGKFWEYHDLLFKNQSALRNADLKSYASQLGLDRTTFDECLDSGAKAARVQADFDLGRSSGVPGAPVYLINGKVFLGYDTVNTFAARLDAALAEVGG